MLLPPSQWVITSSLKEQSLGETFIFSQLIKAGAEPDHEIVFKASVVCHIGSLLLAKVTQSSQNAMRQGWVFFSRE